MGRNSRPKRWADAAGRAVAALNELYEIQQEYQETKDNVPDNLQSTPYYEKLEGVCDLDLESAIATAEEAEGIDLPQGFGRD